jgi:hypothetical protein
MWEQSIFCIILKFNEAPGYIFIMFSGDKRAGFIEFFFIVEYEYVSFCARGCHVFRYRLGGG